MVVRNSRRLRFLAVGAASGVAQPTHDPDEVRERDIEDAHFLADSEFRPKPSPASTASKRPGLRRLLDCYGSTNVDVLAEPEHEGRSRHSCVRVESGSKHPTAGAPLNEYSEFQLKTRCIPLPFGG